MMSLTVRNTPVIIRLNGLSLQGNLSIPEGATSIVIFSHGSGSSRFSPRNNFVAGVLQREGLATLLFDLLTEEEDKVYENRFNIDLLTLRLIDVTHWIKSHKETKEMHIGYFGASTGSASALSAAAFHGEEIGAVVSRGGRPDLAMPYLHKVMSPTLLLVGGLDHAVVEFNRNAMEKLQCKCELRIIPGATHLFEEPGKLEEVAEQTADWFSKQLNKKMDDVSK